MPFRVGQTTIVTDDFKLENIADATGNYGAFHPNVTGLSVGTTENLNFDGTPVYTKVMTDDTTFNTQNIAAGKTIMLLLDTAKRAGSPAVAGFTPSFPSGVKWASDEEPSWADYEGWMITLVGYSTAGNLCFGSATGYNFT